jgi:hypothetical protein
MEEIFEYQVRLLEQSNDIYPIPFDIRSTEEVIPLGAFQLGKLTCYFYLSTENEQTYRAEEVRVHFEHDGEPIRAPKNPFTKTFYENEEIDHISHFSLKLNQVGQFVNFLGKLPKRSL